MSTPPAPLPPLHALAAFEALVRHGTVARALGELGVSRAALSASLALLEERTGLRLLIRHSPTVELTDEGLAYYHAAAAFARGAADWLHGLGSGFATEVRIAASPGVARLWLPARLAALRAACPGVALTLAVSETLSDLDRSECDIAIRYCHPADHEDGRILWHETLGVLAPAPRALALGLRSLPELLASEPLIEHPLLSWSRLARQTGLAALPQAPVLTCHDVYAALLACARGDGLALMPLQLTLDACARHGLRTVHPLRLPDKSYVLLMSARGQARPVVQACAGALAALAQPGPGRAQDPAQRASG
ncbi:LysR family transcriptional regulator [Denitromonas iodatirespirans]|uniref:LysR family transcriptional regulator n=1 Tax=Denitromonas iodatirespirans TaxID=2795389 RepID=A0A944DCM9_DENI1|nr:LysR family transcriptional regulator [Denitromonas iodatirespirans]MBT0964049.1 LysR family transcriptional regulator [Denitromonas iodatirespirans]